MMRFRREVRRECRRFRFYVIGDHFHTTGDHIKVIARHLLLAWGTVNPIARRFNLVLRTVVLDRRSLFNDRATLEFAPGSLECDRPSLSRSRASSCRLVGWKTE